MVSERLHFVSPLAKLPLWAIPSGFAGREGSIFDCHSEFTSGHFKCQGGRLPSESEKKFHVNLRLAAHMAAKLDALCQYYDMDRSHMLRRLIHEEYERTSSREGSAQAESGGKGGGVPPKDVIGISGKWQLPTPQGGAVGKEPKRQSGGSK